MVLLLVMKYSSSLLFIFVIIITTIDMINCFSYSSLSHLKHKMLYPQNIRKFNSCTLWMRTSRRLSYNPISDNYSFHQYHNQRSKIIPPNRIWIKSVHTSTTALYKKKRKSNSDLDDPIVKVDDKNNDGEDDQIISFHWESFDQKGQWITIDYNNIPIERLILPTTDTSTNNTPTQQNNNQNKSKSTVFSPIQPSPVEQKIIRDKLLYIKRDDLLHLRNSNVSGNKARKMLALNELDMEDFPDVVVSYGGPQSNAMVALAAIVESKNVKDVELKKNEIFEEDYLINEIESDSWIMTDEDKQMIDHNEEEDDDNIGGDQVKQKRFIYYTKKLPRYLKNQPNGNLLRALTLGMEMIELKPDLYNEYFGGDNGGSSVAPIDAPVPGSSLWVRDKYVLVLPLFWKVEMNNRELI